MPDVPLVYRVIDPETHRMVPVHADTLPGPITAAEAGLMVGSPPPGDKRVDLGNWLAYPHIRWALTHVDQLGPSATVHRGDGPVWELPTADPDGTGLDLDGLTVDAGDGITWTLDEMLHRTYTDAFLVAHRGRVVVERYFNGMTAGTRHLMFSMTKSFTGLLALLAIRDGALGLDDLLVDHVPEFAATAWDPVTVAQALDMTDGVLFEENYADPDSSVVRYGVALGFLDQPHGWDGPVGAHDGLRSFTERSDPPGSRFNYSTATTDALAWVVARATGQRWTDALAERLWQPMGAASDAGMRLDPYGVGVASGGMFATARDLVRFGLLLANRGRTGATHGSRHVLPEDVVDDIVGGGVPDPDGLAGNPNRAGWSYHRQFWNPRHVLGGPLVMGIHGQRLFVHPDAELVVMKFGSHPVSANVSTDATHASLYRALAEAV